jgi:hypothetical protein
MTTRTLGHLALYYVPGREAPARTLLTDLGCTLVENGPAGFASAVLDEATANHHDNLVYLAKMSDEQWAFEQQVSAAAGEVGERFRARLGEWPEIGPHVGIKYETLDELERTLLALERDLAPGGRLDGHVELTKFRARPGLDADVDARMAASPVFDGDERPAFGDHIVQCFLRTDLFGALTSASTIELDFAFAPFYDRIPTFGR